MRGQERLTQAENEATALVDQIAHQIVSKNANADWRAAQSEVLRLGQIVTNLALEGVGYEEVVETAFPREPEIQQMLARYFDRILLTSGLPNFCLEAKLRAK